MLQTHTRMHARTHASVIAGVDPYNHICRHTHLHLMCTHSPTLSLSLTLYISLSLTHTHTHTLCMHAHTHGNTHTHTQSFMRHVSRISLSLSAHTHTQSTGYRQPSAPTHSPSSHSQLLPYIKDVTFNGVDAVIHKVSQINRDALAVQPAEHHVAHTLCLRHK